MHRYRRGWLVLLVILALLLTGCTDTAADVTGKEQEVEVGRVLFVTDRIGAESSDYVWTILQDCAKRYSYQATLAEVQGQADKASATLNQASEGLYDVVVIDCLEAELASDWVLRNAGYYPEVRYLCLDVERKTDTVFSNVTCVVWDAAAAYYYYGALAALNSESGTVAFLATESGERAETEFLAFYAGAAEVDASVRALYYSIGTEPETQEIKALVTDAVTESADVICLQSRKLADPVEEVLNENETEAYLLLAQTALSEKTEHTAEGVLAEFSFGSELLLKGLFEDCFGGRLKAGDNSMNWFNGALTVENGNAYPGRMDETQQEILRVVRRTARKNEIQTLPDPAWTPEERQERIQNAGKSENRMET